jgi:DNA-binding MarR family transcriptional regulator
MKRQSSSRRRSSKFDGSPAQLLPPMDNIIGNKVLGLANLISRSATLRYRRLLGLPQVSWRIIALLGAQPPMTLNQLSDRAGIDKSQLSRGISRLVKRQIVSRRTSPGDSRALQLALTDRGIGAYAILITAATRRNEQLLAGISRSKRAMLMSLLDRLTERARVLLREDERQGRD